MVHVLDVDATFWIEGRGLVLAALWVPDCEQTIRNGDRAELRAESGVSFRTAIKAIEMIRAEPRSDGRKLLGLMMADELPAEIAMKGTENWRIV